MQDIGQFLRPTYTAHKFQKLPLMFVSGTSHSQLICVGVPETFAVYSGLKIAQMTQ